MSFLLSLLLVIPFVGFIVTWVGGVNQKAAKWLALAFSLAATVLATILLASFLTQFYSRTRFVPPRRKPSQRSE